MSYREKLRQYKEGKLPEAERQSVESDIERQDAISEYLMERLEAELDKENLGTVKGSSEIGTHDEEEIGSHGEKASKADSRGAFADKDMAEIEESERKFQEYVRKSIHRSFRRMGLGVLAILLAVICFIQFGLSPIIDRIYYNPAKVISADNLAEDGSVLSSRLTNQMSRDLAIYTSLSVPGRKMDSVHAVPQGYGVYNLTLSKSVRYGGTRENRVGGQFRRGNLEIYDSNYLRGPYVNSFACYGMDALTDRTYEEQSKTRLNWSYSSLEAGRQAIEQLDDNTPYLAYVTLKRDLDFKEMNRLIKRLTDTAPNYIAEIWQGVNTDSGEHAHYFNRFIGHLYELNTVVLTPEEKEKYPDLSLDDLEMDVSSDELWAKLDDEETMKNHLISMIQYTIDHPKFLEMMGQTFALPVTMPAKMECMNRKAAIDFIEKNGLTYYGFTCLTTKADMLYMLEDEDILAIRPEPYL